VIDQARAGVPFSVPLARDQVDDHAVTELGLEPGRLGRMISAASAMRMSSATVVGWHWKATACRGRSGARARQSRVCRDEVDACVRARIGYARIGERSRSCRICTSRWLWGLFVPAPARDSCTSALQEHPRTWGGGMGASSEPKGECQMIP
jgi:porphobilinogen deaminase